MGSHSKCTWLALQGSKKGVEASNEDEPPVYNRATLETGISEAFSTQTTQALNTTQPQWQMDTTQSMIAERPGPKRIPRRPNKGADACRLVWDYASARTQTKKPMESISILKKLLLQVPLPLHHPHGAFSCWN